ncbi:MAG: riboflavin synthase [Epsilonproteobacteria bacterium]|nr:riboflavin synthase [Campylobacterota bacterium]
MFTGLIREIAKVKKFDGSTLELKANYKPKIGDSIAINGVCLTATEIKKDSFVVEVAKETKSIIPKEKFEKEVHIEPAMRLSDRIEGHILQGHIDTIGEVVDIKKQKDGVDFYIKVDPYFIKYIVPKGSIAIDGVSLTINEVFDSSFRVTIIPHTIQNTLIKNYKIGTKVNIETDFFARYIEHILKHQHIKKPISWRDIDLINMSY